MNLKELLTTKPEDLAGKQHDALKAHVLKVLEGVRLQLLSGNYVNLQNELIASPAGDGYGEDNHFINFGYEENVPVDLYDTLEVLIRLQKQMDA